MTGAWSFSGHFFLSRICPCGIFVKGESRRFRLVVGSPFGGATNLNRAFAIYKEPQGKYCEKKVNSPQAPRFYM